MWRARPSGKGWHFINAIKQLTTTPAPLPMPKSPAKSNTLRYLKILGFGLPATAGSLLGYVWYDPNFRQQLQANIPYVKELLEVILPESDTETPPTRKQIPEIPASFEGPPIPIISTDDKKDTAVEKGFNIIAPELVHAQHCQTSDIVRVEDLCLHFPDSSSTEKDVSVQAGSQEKIDPSAGETQLQRRDEDDKANSAALETLLHKLLANSQILVTEAVKAQTEAAASTRHHSELLKQALNNVEDVFGTDPWEAVAVANREREQALLRASEKVLELKKCVEKLQDVIQEGKNNQVTQNNPVVIDASRQLSEFMKELGNVNSQVRQAEAEANMVQKYKELVEKGRKQFQKEIESLVPAEKLSQGKLSEDELNILIAHSFRRVEQLQKQLLELQTQEQQKLNAALEIQKQEDVQLTEATISEERQRIQEEFEHEKAKLQMDYLVKLETEVRKQLARQAAAHSDHLKDVLAVQKQELTAEYHRVLQYKLLEERERFQTEVAAWISRLKGIEAAVEARAASEKLTRSAQNLWLSCIALNSLITFGSESGDDKQTKPLRSNVQAILEAANQNTFVQTVVENFPDVALDRGINTEDELKDRFYRVTRICRRLGLVDTPNSSLYSYLVSYLHSLLILDNLEALSEADEIDLNELDTFTLLAHAKYWMEKGHMDHALRFMIQLHGESRRAASDWINEARVFLETKQIVRTLMAYASASGLANTF
ncbi:unnamed protein product [Candidula unifasciata]|uniref:MICOS complex subunit MIC60 n=1 Tax=Candidula unifasciata TaxID=100452 RepID=A0A8S4A1N3_9EUPU|nr:unnamed protein product [Candidula unifasciata]